MPKRPSRFDNRHAKATAREANGGLLSSTEVCERLGVKPATLYTYVSRGLIRSVAGENRRQRLYLADDVERVAAKAEARRGHRAVAAGALRFGDPVLDTTITSAGPHRLFYRGRDAIEWVRSGVGFEEVAAWLWEVPSEIPWPGPKASLLRPQTRSTPYLWRLAALLPKLAIDDLGRVDRGGQDVARAQRLIRAFAASVGERPKAAPRAKTIAGTVRLRLDLTPAAEPAIEAALGVIADHELNVSTFAARVAASGGADLYSAIGSALYAFSGPRHGGAPAHIASFVNEVGRPHRAKTVVRARRDRGESIPGFGQPMYPAGDPRTLPLLEWARRLCPRRRPPALATLLAIDEAAQNLDLPPMTVDGGLLALAYALGHGPDEASALFCIGRTAGWVAHIFEQRSSGTLLRPRARYVGV